MTLKISEYHHTILDTMMLNPLMLDPVMLDPLMCWDLSRTNCPTSARYGDGFEYIRIWVIPPRRLVFWDGVPSSYKWY